MPLSYSARLRRDLRDWQERGLIQPEQAERIAAHALAPRGHRHLQAALALCILLLVAPSIIAFVAANWSAMPPAARLILLFLANAAAVSATYLAARRLARDQTGPARRLVDGMATLSLAIAAATLALVGQTFHVAADPRGFPGPSQPSAWRRRSSRARAVPPSSPASPLWQPTRAQAGSTSP